MQDFSQEYFHHKIDELQCGTFWMDEKLYVGSVFAEGKW